MIVGRFLRSPAVRFGLLLPLVAGGLLALATACPPVVTAREHLVDLTARSAATLLPLAGLDVENDGGVLTAAGGRGVRVVKECDALAPMLVFLAAVLVTPALGRQKAWIAAVGVLAIFVLNQVRLAHLLQLSAGTPEAFRRAHGTLWPAALFLVAGALYLAWAARQGRTP